MTTERKECRHTPRKLLVQDYLRSFKRRREAGRCGVCGTTFPVAFRLGRMGTELVDVATGSDEAKRLQEAMDSEEQLERAVQDGVMPFPICSCEAYYGNESGHFDEVHESAMQIKRQQEAKAEEDYWARKRELLQDSEEQQGPGKKVNTW
ncbi:MAG: hypothetical protein AAFX93_20105 [Verrucomicrobiota bacterium]